MALLAATLCLSCAASAEVRPELQRVEKRVIDDTNAFRGGEGRKPVERNPRLEEAARAFADYMAKTGRYGHDADGSTPSARADRHGYNACIVSENIAYQYSSEGFSTAALAEQLVEGWKKSPGHRRNMLDRSVTQTGVAVARNPRTGYYYSVQMFGRPRSDAIEFEVRNKSGVTPRYRVGDESFALAPRALRRHTQCREETLSLEGAREGNSSHFETRNGDRFVVVPGRGRITLERE